MADLRGGQSWKMYDGGRGRWAFPSEIRQTRMMGPKGRRTEKGKLSDIPEALNCLWIPAGDKQDTLARWMEGQHFNLYLFCHSHLWLWLFPFGAVIFSARGTWLNPTVRLKSTSYMVAWCPLSDNSPCRGKIVTFHLFDRHINHNSFLYED